MRGATIVFSSFLVAAAGVAAPPVGGGAGLPGGGKLPQPSLLKSYSVQLYDNGVYGMRVPQFDPAKGTLRSVKAKLSGIAGFKVTLNAAPPGPLPYALTAYAPAYIAGGNAWFDLKAAKSGSWTDGTVQSVYAPAEPYDDGYAKGSDVLKLFTGMGTLGIGLFPDLPQFSEGKSLVKTVEKGQSSVSGSVTYTYLPKLGPIIYKPK